LHYLMPLSEDGAIRPINDHLTVELLSIEA